jgi:hypothetical protein
VIGVPVLLIWQYTEFRHMRLISASK